MGVDTPARVLVVAPTPPLAADLAALVRMAGLTVTGEAKGVDQRAIGAADVIVIAAGTPIIGSDVCTGLPDQYSTLLERPTFFGLSLANERDFALFALGVLLVVLLIVRTWRDRFPVSAPHKVILPPLDTNALYCSLLTS